MACPLLTVRLDATCDSHTLLHYFADCPIGGGVMHDLLGTFYIAVRVVCCHANSIGHLLSDKALHILGGHVNNGCRCAWRDEIPSRQSTIIDHDIQTPLVYSHTKAPAPVTTA